MGKQYDYEKFHQKYPVDIHDHPARHIKVAELCRGVVFDIGCGTGTLSDYFQGVYLGFDIARSAIDKAKNVRRKTAMFEVCDAMTIAKEDFSKADTIVMSEFLEHIYEDEYIFNAILKTARRGTQILISVPNGSHFDCDEHVRQFTIPILRAKLSKYGRVRFYNWDGAAGQIICTVTLGEPQRADLSLVMIVKDEEKGLEKAILSVIESVDNIVIAVDNSSGDKTAAIARQYADTLKFYDWKDDFAKARNDAHDGVKTKWILFLDGHEYLKKIDGLDEKLKSNSDGLMCRIEMENGMQFNNPRIYKNGLQFVGAVHEKQQCKQVIYFLDCVIQHDRENSQSAKAAEERKKQRDDMVPRIMGEQYKKNHKNTRATFHLGMHAFGTGNVRNAVKWFRRYLKYSDCKGERWFVFFHMALTYLVQGKLFRAFWYANRADWETPGRWEINKLKGMIYFERGKYFEAAEFLLNTFYQNKGNVDYKPWVRDDGGTWNSAGECFYRLGDYEKAYHAFCQADKQCKDEKVRVFFRDRAKLMRDLTKAQISGKV